MRAALCVLLAAIPLSSCAKSSSPPLSWKNAKSWGYQLQNASLEELERSPFDILVIDYSRDGTDARRWTAEQVARIKRKPGGGGRLVLAYLSIGEAEDYRYYWDPAWKKTPPSWLEVENPDWKGNIKVRYWEKAWQDLVSGYLDRIVDAGFDGVYLDVVDAYWYFQNKGRKSARDEMKTFVLSLARHARAKPGKAGFAVFPQNAEGLLEDSEYLSAITGIGKESVYFGYAGEGKATPKEETLRVERLLDRAAAAGKTVLTADYVTGPEGMLEAHRRARAKGYLEYCGTRELDGLLAQPAAQR